MQPIPNVKATAAVLFAVSALAFSLPASAQQQGGEANSVIDRGVVDLPVPAEAQEDQDSTGGPLTFLQSLFGGSQAGATEQNSEEAALAEVGGIDGGTDASTVRAVDLMAAGGSQNVLQRSFFGQVRARETADLSFGVGGTLDHLPIAEGVVIDEGETLAALDLAPFERAVERAELQLEQAERALTRAEQLEATSVGTRTRVEDARTVRDLADVALREARDALEDAVIAAPYRALIAERLAANYTSVEPATPIVRVHDISQMRVEIDLPERLVQRLPDIRNHVEFTAILPGADEPVVLQLAEFQAETQAVGQSYLFSFALPEGSATHLLPGSSLTVTASLPVRNRVVVLPPTAIVVDEVRDSYVMVFEPADGTETSSQGTVRSVPVEVSSTNGTSFVVSGVPEDVELVRIGAHLLRDGQQVRRYTGLKSDE